MNWTKIQPLLKIEPSILFGILNHCRYLLQSNPLTKKSAATVLYVFMQWACLRPAAHVLPLFSSHPSRLCLNATEMSVTFAGYMWTLVPGSVQKSPLLLQCHLWFGAVWQRPLSQALRVSWVRLAWNSTVPDGRLQSPGGRREANDETWFSPLPVHKHLQCTVPMTESRCFAQSTETQFPGKWHYLYTECPWNTFISFRDTWDTLVEN